MYPIVLHGALGHAKEMGDFLDVEPGEEPELDDPGLTFIEPGERFERGVQAQKLVEVKGGIVRRRQGFRQRDTLPAAAPFFPSSTTGVVDEEAPHDVGTDGEKMRAATPVHSGLIDQLQVRLVNQGGRLQRVSETLAPHVERGPLTQLVVDEWQKVLSGG